MSLTVWLFRRVSIRHWRSAPGQNALLVVILALGVAAFIAIRLANRAAVASFEDFTDTLTGASDWVIEAPAGSLPESILPQLRSAVGDEPVGIAPIVETTAVLHHAPGTSPESFSLVGIDLVGITNLATLRSGKMALASPDEGKRFTATGRKDGSVWVPARLAGLNEISALVDDRDVTLPVAGAIPVAEEAPAPDHLLVMDIPDLQAICGKQGRLDRVDFVVASGPDAERRRERLGALLNRLGQNGERWLVHTPGARRETAETMTAAFRLNLTILSLIALLVGLYLIFQSLDGAVVRRRSEIAILTSLGVDPALIRRSWLVEAGLLGLIGGLVGTGLGWLSAQAAVRAVGQTVNALYYTSTVHSASLDLNELWLGLALGTAAGIAAGWWPAREASRTPPAQILGRTGAAAPGAIVWRNPTLGILLLIAGTALVRAKALHLPDGTRFPLAGYAAALAWIVGGGMVWASSLPLIGRFAKALRRGSASAKVANGHMNHPSGRHRLAAAALLCAVGMCAGMAILVSSFEATVSGWVDRSLKADLYMTSAGMVSASSTGHIPASTVRLLRQVPGVAEVSPLSSFPVVLGGGPPAILTGVDLAKARSHADFPWAERPADDTIFDPARNHALALVSESFSERFGKGRGDAIDLPTPSGIRHLTIAGVYADYGNERGSIVIDRPLLVDWMQDDASTHVSIYAAPGQDPSLLRLAIMHAHPGLRVYTNGSLKDQILQVFRQTFSITYALEVIGVFVAIVGLALAMTSLLLDRRDELTTLRALGFGRGDIAVATSLEGFAVALWSSLGGLALSLALGWLLIHVINKQSFGWTLAFSIPIGGLIALVAAVSLAGLGASYAVGFWGSQLPADREE